MCFDVGSPPGGQTGSTAAAVDAEPLKHTRSLSNTSRQVARSLASTPLTPHATDASMRPSHHKAALSLSASIDLDVEGGSGGRLDEDYDAGWRAADVPWSAKGPASFAPRMTLKQSALAHLGWARAGWWDANRWGEAWRVAKR